MLSRYKWLITLGAVVLGVLAGHPHSALAEPEKQPLPAALERDFAHLRETLETPAREDFSPQRIASVLDFLLKPTEENVLYHGGEWRDAPSAFYRFDLQTDLKSLIEYGFNPDIPSSALLPSSIRVGDWTEVDGQKQPLPRLWEKLAELDTPIVVRGIEFNENTPDESTGAYHAYDLERALILFRHQGSPVFISLSLQPEKSSVGRKGAILGPDSQWDYLYSDEVGLTIGGLGWADSYLYESFSAVIFYQPDPAKPQLRCGIIKWLRAGWLGMNMVKTGHIQEGLVRFVEGMKAILEDPQLPPPQRLIAGYRDIRQLSDRQLRERVNHYVERIRTEHAEDSALDQDPFSRLVRKNNYAELMTRREMQGVLDLELMKCALGRSCAEQAIPPGLDPIAEARPTLAREAAPRPPNPD